MDLSTYNFPKNGNTTKELVEEAKARKPIKGIRKFTDIFFSGGTLLLKGDVKGTWKEVAYIYALDLMQSFAPSHEDKELVCGMIFEECLILD